MIYLKKDEIVGQITPNTVIQGDCLDVMKHIGDKTVDMVLCDLPYGTTACSWDTVIPFEPLWKEYKRLIKDNGAIVLTGSQPFTSALVMSNIDWFKYELIWEKDRPSNIFLANLRIMPQHENILIFYNKQPTFNPQMNKRLDKNKRKFTPSDKTHEHLTGTKGETKITACLKGDSDLRYPYSINHFKCNKINALHPTQKPVDLFRYLIKTYTNEGDTVLDNCLGSGTTLIACSMENRNVIGIEKEEKYYKLAVKRYKNHISQSVIQF